MKKLKIGLILAFSMLLTLGLAACGGGNEDPTPEPEPTPEEETHNISSIRFGGESTIELIEDTDSTAAQNKFDEAVADLELRIYSDNAREVMTGAQFNWDTSVVDWDAPGNYSVTGTPVLSEDNAIQNENNVTIDLEVSINHDFSGGFNDQGVAVCKSCGATQTRKTYTDPIHVNYDGFHAGLASGSTQDPDGYLQSFGTVETSEGNKTVGSYTAGTLTRGMTISVSGSGTNNNNTTATWYFPIIGVAVRNFTADIISDSSYAYNTEIIEGGASVLVRNDGWVLLNGIGDDRLLAGFAGGTSESYNHTSIVSTMPATSDMAMWHAYATGTPCYSAEYVNETDVTYTWSFSDDGIIEMIMANDLIGTALTIRMRVPDSIESIDTVIHGEFFDLSIDSLTITEMALLEEIRAELTDNAQMDYVEGEYFDMSSFSIQTRFEGSETFNPASGFALQTYTGTATELAAAQEDTENWIAVLNDTPLSSAYKFFRVRVLVGSTVKYAYFTVGEEGFIDQIAPNNVDVAYGHDVQVGDTAAKNDLALGELGYHSEIIGEGDGTIHVVIAPQSVANALTGTLAGQYADYTHYLSFRIWASDGKMFNNISVNEAPLFVSVASDGAYADVFIVLNATVKGAGVTISGLQDTPIYIDLSGVTLPGIGVSVEGVGAGNTISMINGNDVTFTYTIEGIQGTTEEDKLNDLKGRVSVGIGTVPSSLNYVMWTGNTFTDSLGILVGNDLVMYSGEVSFSGNTATIEITYELPGFTSLSNSHPGYFAVLFDYDGVMRTDRVYYAAPVASEAAAAGVYVFELGNDVVMVNTSGTSLVFSLIRSNDNVQDVAGLMPIEININAGAATANNMLGTLDLTANIAEGAVELVDINNPIVSIYSGAVAVMGTANMEKDSDIGFIYSGSIRTNLVGIASASATYYVELKELGPDGGSIYLKVVNGSITDATTEVTEAIANVQVTELKKGTCLENGLTAKAMTVNGTIVFYAEMIASPAAHTWVPKQGAHAVFECSVCHALFTDEFVQGGTNGGFKTGALEDASAKGITVSYEYASVGSDDWTFHVLKTTTNNLIIGGGTVDPWNVSTDGLEGELLELANAMRQSNLYPGKADGAQIGASVSPYQETKSGYTTIVVDPQSGIKFYVNGDLKIHYTLEHESSQDGKTGYGTTVENIITLFLALAEESGVTVAAQNMGASNVIVQVGVLSDDAIHQAYVNSLTATYPTGHSWVTDTSDDNYGFCSECGIMNPNHEHLWITDSADENYGLCKVCSVMNPDHVHVYERGVCIVKGCGALDTSHVHEYVNGVCSCGALCVHEGVENGSGNCSVCGATLATSTQTLTEDNSFTSAAYLATYYNNGQIFSFEAGTSITLSGTMTSQATANWDGLLFDIARGPIIRCDAYALAATDTSLFGAGASGANENYAVTSSMNGAALDWTQYLADIKAGVNWTAKFDFTDSSKIVVTLELKNETNTYNFTYECTFLENVSIPATMTFRLSGEKCSATVTSITDTTVTFSSAN